MTHLYPYVGPADVKASLAGPPAGMLITSAADILAWVHGTGELLGRDGLVAATFIIDERGDLLLADRCSEHLTSAGGEPGALGP
jgi:hypothetical protein